MADAAAIANAFVDENIEVVHHNRGVEISGRDNFGALLGAFKGAFPDKRFENRRAEHSDGDTAIIAHTWTGTAAAPVPGFAENAGDVARLDLCTIYTVRDGLIVAYHDYG
jgi:ketosteroid isomerase-like protein